MITITKEELCSFYEQHSSSIYRLALSYTRSIHDAEDIVQQAFTKLLIHQDTIDLSNIKGWLIKVAINECRNLNKSFWKSKCNIGEITEHMAQPLDKEESDLLTSLMKLPQKYRIIIHLYYYEEFSYKEIAKQLNLKESTVSMRLTRGRDMLKKLLKNLNNDYQ